MGLFSNLKGKDNNLSPIIRTKDEVDKRRDSMSEFVFNCLWIRVAALCATSAKAILTNQPEVVTNLETQNQMSNKIKELESRCRGKIYKSKEEEEKAISAFDTLILMKDPRNPNFAKKFKTPEDVNNYVENVRTWCYFLASEKSEACIKTANERGYNIDMMPIMYEILVGKNGEYSSQHPYSQAILNFYDKYCAPAMQQRHEQTAKV